MQIQRRPSHATRRGGPSCLTIVLGLLGLVFAAFLSANAQEVRDVLVPSPTPLPTRSAASYATSASLYARDGDYEQAIASYENAIQLDPKKSEYYVKLIDLLTRNNQAESALFWAERVYLLEPNNGAVLTSVAAAYLLNGNRLAEIGAREEANLQYQRAIDTADQAIKVDGSNATAYAYLAGALINQSRDNFARAQEMVDTAVVLAPDNAIVRYYRALVFENQGYYKQAIAEYETAVGLDPAYVDPALALAYSYFYSDNRQRAILILRDLIDNNPRNANAHDALGWFYFLAGQYPEAETVLEQAVELDPDMIRARAHLGAAYYRQFNYENAIPELELAVNSYDEVTATRALFYNMLAFSYYRLYGDCEKAEPLFREVISLGIEDLNVENAQAGLEECRQANLQNSTSP